MDSHRRGLADQGDFNTGMGEIKTVVSDVSEKKKSYQKRYGHQRIGYHRDGRFACSSWD